MSTAPERRTTLTRAQRKVLADIELFSDRQNRAVLSSRGLAETTGLSRRTVQAAIDRLNELQLIRTVTGTRTRPSEHRLVPVRLGGGAISSCRGRA
jgi:DNA-binding GntR family transcriptional regulator